MSGDDVREGDIVRINFERHGNVVSIVEDDSLASSAHYFSAHGPGVLFNFDGWGNVYYPAENIDNDEDLFLVKRGEKR
jgi:hypothetical protein